MEKQKRLEQTVLRIFGDLSLHSIQRNVLYETLAGVQVIAQTNSGLRIQNVSSIGRKEQCHNGTESTRSH